MGRKSHAHLTHNTETQTGVDSGAVFTASMYCEADLTAVMQDYNYIVLHVPNCTNSTAAHTAH